MEDKVFEEIFPFKQTGPRKNQREIIENIISEFEAGKKYIFLNLPTGAGKSVIGYTVSNYFDSGRYLVHQKQLQDQYYSSFKKCETPIEICKGKSNYICSRNFSLTCNMGLCSLTPKSDIKCSNCSYKINRDKALNSKHQCFNYDFFLNITKTSLENLTSTNVLVLDEAHNLEDTLINHCCIKLSRDEFKKHNIALPKFPNKDNSYIEKFNWLTSQVLPVLSKQEQDLMDSISSMSPENHNYIKILKSYKFINEITCKITELSDLLLQDKSNKIITEQNYDFEIEFKPLFGGYLANNKLFNWSPRILIMSATLPSKKTVQTTFNIKDKDMSYITYQSDWNPENNKKILLNIGSLSYKNKENTYPKMIQSIKMILDNHPKERGIIHTNSYEILTKIVENIDSERFIIPRGHTRDSQIKYFMNSDKEDLILLSPSLEEGLDLSMDLCRFSILCKVPFGSLASNYIKERLKYSQDWYIEQAIITILQSIGRGVRSETDYCVNYLLDSDFIKLINDNQNKFSDYFMESLETW